MTVRHGATSMMAAPTLGANTGTRMNVAMTCDMVRAMWSPEKRSRIMASASERGAAAPSPHSTRQTTTPVSVGITAAAAALTA
jgi:hypothetical protein